MIEHGTRTNSSSKERPVSPQFLRILHKHLKIWSEEIGPFVKAMPKDPLRISAESLPIPSSLKPEDRVKLEQSPYRLEVSSRDGIPLIPKASESYTLDIIWVKLKQQRPPTIIITPESTPMIALTEADMSIQRMTSVGQFKDTIDRFTLSYTLVKDGSNKPITKDFTFSCAKGVLTPEPSKNPINQDDALLVINTLDKVIAFIST